jgi:DNA-directed RNA polymerase alpha subunit
MCQENALWAKKLGLKLMRDGNQFVLLWGDDPQSGVAGFGSTPAEALLDFERAMHKKLPTAYIAKNRCKKDTDGRQAVPLGLFTLGLNNRTINRLVENKIKTVDTLSARTSTELKEMKGIGSRMIKEIIAKLRKVGTDLQPE